MELERFVETVTALKYRKPYHPFTIVLDNGNRHEIDFADAILVREGLVIFAAPRGIPVLFDHDSVSEVIGDLANNPPEE